MSVNSAKILIVDDIDANRNILKRHFTRMGHTVAEAANGQLCLDYLENYECDLVLLDIMMPVMDGITALQHIRKTYSLVQLPVIMVTALNDIEHSVNALKSGANDYITKPFDFEMLVARSQTHLVLKQLAAQNQEFLSIASHDIKKPLALIMDIAEVVCETLAQPDPDIGELIESMGLLTRSAQTMQKHIEDYLDLSIVENGQIKLNQTAVQLNDLIEGCLEQNAEYAASKNIELKLNLEEKLPLVSVDNDRIMQVIDNVVGNAIKYSPPDTTTVIRSYAVNDNVMFEVSDQGPGIKEKDMENIFMKHRRTENMPTGGEVSTGLGLAISKQIVILHDGEIGIRPNDDIGVTFWVSLPRSQI